MTQKEKTKYCKKKIVLFSGLKSKGRVMREKVNYISSYHFLSLILTCQTHP